MQSIAKEIVSLLEEKENLTGSDAIRSLTLAALTCLRRFGDIRHLAPQAEVVRDVSLKGLDQVREHMAQPLVADLWGLLAALKTVVEQGSEIQQTDVPNTGEGSIG